MKTKTDPTTTTHPNVLVILTDDQGCWAAGCAGNSEIRTPNLDRLAASGLRFENVFCASPVCSPARATLLTGRMPSQHGVHDWLWAGNTTAKYEPVRNGELIEYLKGQPGYTDYLAAAGYTCGLSGKWHLGDSHHAQKGFTFWETHAMGGGPYYGAPMITNGAVYSEPRYVTDAITDNALRFLEQEGRRGAPFYLSVHYTAPHAPWGREHHPADLFDDYFNNCAFDSAPDGLAYPSWVLFREIPVDDAQTRRSHLSGYYAAVTAMDRNVGRLLDWLEAAGLRENTLVVFTSDNGMNMGHHGVYGKGNATFPLNMFEESVKVPFIVSQPGIVPQGGVCAELLSHYDFLPTILEYSGTPAPDLGALPGGSFAPLLRGEEFRGREQVVICDEYGPVRMVRTKHWKYIHRYAYGPNELYDLRNDPSEKANLAGEPACQAKVAEMRARLEEWFLRYSEPCRDGLREAVTGSGQVGLVGPAGAGMNAFCDVRVRHVLPGAPKAK